MIRLRLLSSCLAPSGKVAAYSRLHRSKMSKGHFAIDGEERDEREKSRREKEREREEPEVDSQLIRN